MHRSEKYFHNLLTFTPIYAILISSLVKETTVPEETPLLFPPSIHLGHPLLFISQRGSVMDARVSHKHQVAGSNPAPALPNKQ